MRASKVRPSSNTKALSVPMRVLLPPARTNAETSLSMPRSYLLRQIPPVPDTFKTRNENKRKYLIQKRCDGVHESNLHKVTGSSDDGPASEALVRPGS